MNVVYVPLVENDATNAAWQWLLAHEAIDAARASVAGLAAVIEAVPDVVWIDGPSPPADIDGFRAIAATRGSPGFLLTGGAVLLPCMLGLEPVAPDAVIDRTWRDSEDELFLFRDFSETPRIRGHAAFRNHRIFDGLGCGAYTWWPHDGDAYRAFTYTLPRWPELAGVVAVERAFIHIEHGRATIWEFAVPRIVCIGAYLPFESDDPLFRPHLERLTANTLLHLAGLLPARVPDRFWRAPRNSVVRDEGLPLPALPRPNVANSTLPFHLSTLRLRGERAEDPFTLAGRRGFAAGHEGRGVEEVWFHPVRVMMNVRLPDASRTDTTDLGIVRRIETGQGVIIERTFVPRELPGLVIEWETDSTETLELRLEWDTDLRLMWPYAAGVLGPLHFRCTDTMLRINAPESGEAVTFAVDAADASFAAASVGENGRMKRYAHHSPDAEDPGSGQAACVHASLRLRIAAGAPARLLVAGRSAAGDDDAAVLASIADAASHVRARAGTVRRLHRERLSIVTPDTALDQAVEWAKHRLDAFVVDTPDVGRSLVAGYWMSRPGWNDGRPGYAWYFGRDSVWTAFASLATGDFDSARDVIDFLARHQDLNGKILHECTTSGSVHYDSADATPLWLLLVARHNAWSGNIAFTRSRWPQVVRALEFCQSTDSDGDGLIENTRVGHGWIEFGRLGGGRATFYNAGIWTAALRELAIAAESIGEREAAARFTDLHRTARASLASRFHDPGRDAWALRIDPADYTPTATHAVPLLLGSIEAESTRSWLDLVASGEFTADWGVRMLARSDAAFDPAGYHGGAVWPLYTGWVSWAEYAAGRPESAFRHWTQIASLATRNAKGAWDEVLHGEKPDAIGVCPDQAWSAAMALSPFVFGLLGADPDATRNRLTLRPQIPEHWEHLDIFGLRIGDASISLRFRRDGRRCIFRIEQESGAVPIRLIFEPAVSGRAVAARVDGQDAQLAVRPFGDRILAPVQLVLDHERVLELEVPE